MPERYQNSPVACNGGRPSPRGGGPVSRQRLAPALILMAAAAVAVLAMFIVPFKNRGGLNTSVVTTEVREIDSSLRRLAAHVEAGRNPAAQKEASGLRRAWEGLQPGLVRRGLEESAAALAFQGGLASMEASIGGDKTLAGRNLRALNGYFVQVKEALRGATVIQVPRLLLVGGGILLLLVVAVQAVFTLSQRLGLKG